MLLSLAPQYQSATLSEQVSGVWRICWYNYHPDKKRLERIRQTFNINRIRDITERRRVGLLYVQLINEALRKGYNYWVDTMGLKLDPVQIKAAMPTVPEPVSIVQALDRALKTRVLGTKPRTASSYRSNIKTLTDWLTANELHTMPVTDFTADHFQDFLFYKSSLGHGNANLNEHLSFNKTTFNVIRKNLKLIKENPLTDLDYLTEQESRLFQPLTPDEIARIVPVLIAYSPRFYLFTKFIPDEYIRPHHIARLQSCDIHYHTDLINVGGDTTKNNRTAEKQLLKSIKRMLLDMEYNKLPGHYYLFGKNFEPSPTLYPSLSIRAAEIWKELVIDGLGIHKKMYAMKHTAMQYFVNNNENVDIYYLRQQAEHNSAAITEIYLQKNIMRRINEKSIKTIQY